LFEFSKNLSKFSISFEKLNPAYEGKYLVIPVIDAWLRWDAEKASLIYMSKLEANNFEKLTQDKELTKSIRDLTIGLSKFLNEIYP